MRRTASFGDILVDVIEKYEDELMDLDPEYIKGGVGNANRKSVALFSGDLETALLFTRDRRVKEVLLSIESDLDRIEKGEISSRRSASEIINNLEMRTARLEKVASWERDLSGFSASDKVRSIGNTQSLETIHRKQYRKTMVKFLLELDDRATDYAIDDLGLGDYLGSFNRKADRYYNTCKKEILASVPKEIATWDNYIDDNRSLMSHQSNPSIDRSMRHVRGLGYMVACTLEIMFENIALLKENKSLIIDLANEMLEGYTMKEIKS